MPGRQLWFDRDDGTDDDPDVAVIGMPYDGSATLRTGAAKAPDRLRQISRTCDPITRHGQPVGPISVRDFGNVVPAETQSQRDYLDNVLERLIQLPAGAFVISLGGDNSISIPSIRRFVAVHGEEAGIIWFDAHPDLFESYEGNPDSHACALRRAMGLSGLPSRNIALLGTRSYSSEEHEYINKEGIEVVTGPQCATGAPGGLAQRLAGRLGHCRAIYLAVDIDGFDASAAPGTGYPTPGGPSSEAMFLLLEELYRRLPIRAMDLTEICPPLDPNDATSFLGVQVILESMAAISA